MNARKALAHAFFLGRVGGSISEIEKLVEEVKSDDLVWMEVASLKREVAVLRREVEASRPHKVVAIGKKVD
jgi:hypothetical protein